MGEEDVVLKGGESGPRFWEEDDLLDRKTCERDIGIFGGGDGALQDVLRALTGLNHPVEMIRVLCNDSYIKNLIEERADALASIEAQGRLYGSWTLGSDAFRVLDASCREVAASLASDKRMKDAVSACIRKRGPLGAARVIHVVREPHFTKTYLLNRFLVHLIDRVQANGGIPDSRMKYTLLLEHEPTGSKPGRTAGTSYVKISPVLKTKAKASRGNGAGSTSNAKPERRGKWFFFDRIAVRFGMKEGSKASSGGYHSGMQMIQLTEDKVDQRTTLSHVPVPFLITA